MTLLGKSSHVSTSLLSRPVQWLSGLGRVVFANANIAMGSFLVVAFVIAGLVAPLLYPTDPFLIVGTPRQWPGDNPAFPLGTDALGRDMLAGLLHGARVSLMVGLVATLVSLVVGISLGALGGYFGGVIDAVIVRLIEVFQTMPAFVLLVVVLAIVEPSIAIVTFAIGITSWDQIARLTRAEYRSLREREFVLAGRTIGFSVPTMIFREILPNALPPLLTAASLAIASAILTESALSFMGLGDPNVISWGSMISAGKDHLRTSWYIAAIPGTAIALAALALNLLGQGIVAALDPRNRVR